MASKNSKILYSLPCMPIKKKLYEIPSKGFEAFNEYYSRMFGSRWDSLLHHLLHKNRVIAFVNPFFDRFKIEPHHFHPRGQWCTDPELYGCMCVPVRANENEKEIGNFLHPIHLRHSQNNAARFTSDTYDAEWKELDRQWFETHPNPNKTVNNTYYFNQSLVNRNQMSSAHVLKLSSKDLDPYYLMDASSIRIARMIDTSNGSMFLDMCASPGGKSLVLLNSILNCHNSELDPKLIANEFSFKRIQNLRGVFSSYVPNEIRSQNICVTNFDAKMWGIAEQNKYDSILLDVPCTGDRHLLLNGKKYISQWSVKRLQNNSKTQFGLLRSAINACKIGGEILYATCALSDVENDQLIEQILSKRREKVEVVSSVDFMENGKISVGEKTEYGWRILPDTTDFMEGPLYFAKLRRIN